MEWLDLHGEMDLLDRKYDFRVDPITGFIEEVGGVISEIESECPICSKELDIEGRCVSCLDFSS
jgi:hypothetical protein